ncbi:MAG: holo-ACP synthase [Bdellovibrionota bacterium]
MEIIGIGIDLQEIAPFKKQLQNHQQRFFSRLFTAGEREYCESKKNPAQHYAARFCAKEAAVKAVSSRTDALITHFEIVSDEKKPKLVISSVEKDRPSFLDEVKFMVTLSHTDQYAVAQVLAFLA